MCVLLFVFPTPKSLLVVMSGCPIRLQVEIGTKARIRLEVEYNSFLSFQVSTSAFSGVYSAHVDLIDWKLQVMFDTMRIAHSVAAVQPACHEFDSFSSSKGKERNNPPPPHTTTTHPLNRKRRGLTTKIGSPTKAGFRGFSDRWLRYPYLFGAISSGGHCPAGLVFISKGNWICVAEISRFYKYTLSILVYFNSSTEIPAYLKMCQPVTFPLAVLFRALFARDLHPPLWLSLPRTRRCDMSGSPQRDSKGLS
jgi:hypothetical protein